MNERGGLRGQELSKSGFETGRVEVSDNVVAGMKAEGGCPTDLIAEEILMVPERVRG